MNNEESTVSANKKEGLLNPTQTRFILLYFTSIGKVCSIQVCFCMVFEYTISLSFKKLSKCKMLVKNDLSLQYL